jgi:hypothetical protein
MQTGLAQTFAFRTRLEKLVELGLIEATRNFAAWTERRNATAPEPCATILLDSGVMLSTTRQARLWHGLTFAAAGSLCCFNCCSS